MTTTKRTSLTFKIKPIFVKHIFVTHNSPTKTSISHCSNLNYILVLRRFPPLARGGRAFRRFASERFSHLSQAERLLTSFSLCSKLAGWPPSARLQSLTQKKSCFFIFFLFKLHKFYIFLLLYICGEIAFAIFLTVSNTYGQGTLCSRP